MMNSPASGARRGGARARIYQVAVRLFAESGRDVTVSDLADAAGIARGTIYNNIKAPESLFGDVASSLSHEMILRTEATMRAVADPTERIAIGMRLFVRRAHEEPDWGRFLVRFAFNDTTLHGMMREPPARDIARAIDAGLFKADMERVPALVSMLAGTTLAAMTAVVRGDQAWRTAGTDAAELFLRAGGVGAATARRLATLDLPPLATAARPAARPAKRRKP